METIEIKPNHAAIVDGVCLMMVADGELHPKEVAFLQAVFANMLKVSDDVVTALIDNSLSRLETADTERFIAHIVERLVDREDREGLMIALQLASLADGFGHEYELVLLETFVERFGMSEEEVRDVVHKAQALYSVVAETMGGGVVN